MLKIENLHVSVERRAILNDVNLTLNQRRVSCNHGIKRLWKSNAGPDHVEIRKIIELAVSGSM